MRRQSVSSSNIAEVGYDADRRILEVLFLNGGLYQYFDVPEVVHRAFLSAGSHGKYLNEQIKGRYRYARV